MSLNAGLNATLKIEPLISNRHKVEMTMPITSEVLQPFGFLHGGATIALLEAAASLGALNNANLEKELPFGVDIHVKHHKSGKRGTVRGVAELDRCEGNKQFWNVAAYDDDGDIISDGVIMTKIVSLERFKEIEEERKKQRDSS